MGMLEFEKRTGISSPHSVTNITCIGGRLALKLWTVKVYSYTTPSGVVCQLTDVTRWSKWQVEEYTKALKPS